MNARPKPRKVDPDTTEAVDEFMATLDHPMRFEIEAIRKAILGAHRSIHEGVKWNSPSFRTFEYFATVNLRAKAGIGVILHLGAKVRALPEGGVRIEDPKRLLKWLAKDRAMVEFADRSDMKGKMPEFVKIVRQWIDYV